VGAPGQSIGFLGRRVVQQTSGANLTNSVTAGGVKRHDRELHGSTVYANDAAAIRNDIYQLARKAQAG